jgi:hypothetical protein
MSDPTYKLLASQVLNIFLTQSLVTFSCSYKKSGTGDAEGWRWLRGWYQRHSSPPNRGVSMDINSWLVKLNKWGFKDALARPKLTVGFYVAFLVVRWVAIAIAIAVAAMVWMLISVIAGLFKSL